MFDREVIITIVGDTGQIVVKDLRMTFDVVKTDKAELNKGTVTLYNMLPAKSNEIKKDDSLIISAGYLDEGGAQIIFVGTITKVSNEFKAPDILFKIDAKTGEKRLKRLYIKKEFRKNITVREILKVLAADSLYTLYTNLDTLVFDDITISNGWDFVGTIKAALDKVTDMVNLNWTIEDDELKIFDRYKPETVVSVFLDSKSGMIESPKRIKIKHKHKDTNIDGIEVLSLLQNQMVIKAKVQIKSKAVSENSNYTITALKHVGDSWQGDMQTTVEAIDAT